MTERKPEPPVRGTHEEEAALHSRAVLVERTDRRRWVIGGRQAAEVLNGLVTNDVARLAPGAGCYAAALTPKGKVIADLRILARESDYVLDTGSAAGSGWAEVLRKYVNPRMATYGDVTDSTADVAVAGPKAASVLAAALKLSATDLAALVPHSHLRLARNGEVALAVRTPELDVPAFDLLIPTEQRTEMVSLLVAAGAERVSSDTWEIARIARGWPAWGRDMDENTLAQEASLDRFDAISYDKGCYTGQETVARVHFRGHVNRYLRRARFQLADAIPARAELLGADDRPVGEVRSSALSTHDGGVAIVMLRRELGAGSVTARWDTQAADIRVLDDAG